MPRTRTAAAPLAAAPVVVAHAGAAPADTDPLVVTIEGLRYALDAVPRRHGRKSVITVRLAAPAGLAAGPDAAADDAPPDLGPPLVDRCDLFAFRSRRAFAQLVADQFGRDAGQVLGHLAVLLDHAERVAAPGAAAPVAEALTPARRDAAERLLAAEDLLDRAALALEHLGHVGEEEVKRLAYLVATSRLLARPLSALLLAPSGTGKSAILDAVAALLPPEAVVTLARLTPQALFYAGPDALRHRLVIVDEFEGQQDAAHAVRVLQSRGELRQSVTIKGRAEEVVARGPVAVMSGTTLTDLDPQNLSRCVELALDDGPEQTRRVQAAQARAWAGGAGGGGARGPRLDLQAWHDAQRLLAEEAPVAVAIPFAPTLVFPARTTADRRTSAKVLGLVAAHALLHARQRPRDREGRVVAAPEDHAAVVALLRPAAADALDGLSPRAARLLRWLAAEGQPRTRRQAAAALAWGYNTAKRAAEELLAQEAVAVVDRGPPAAYRVLDRTLLGVGADADAGGGAGT